jgi:RNA polymerase sigma-70 factor (ECF subfamily)
MSYLNFQSDLLANSQFLRPSAIKLTQSLVLAEDLVQETIFKALKNSDKFQEGTNLKSWLYTIMRNIFINDYRKKKKQNTVSDDSEEQYLLNSMSFSNGNLGEMNLLDQELTAAMAKVPNEILRPFMMHHSGFKYNEIAEELDIPLGTVKSKIFFARKALKKSLSEMGVHSSRMN